MPPLSRSRFLALALLTVVTMLPVTAVVPVLKPLIADRYGVRDLAASTFMSLNMAGALLAAPIVGRVSDRRGWTRRLLVPAALLDAALWWGMAAAPPFWLLSLLRFAEGAAHITVLSLLLAAVSRTCADGGRRLRMAAMGGALVLGVAAGAPLGGLVGADDPGRPLQLGALAMIVVAAASVLVVPASRAGAPDGGPGTASRSLVPSRALQLPYVFAFVDRLTVGFFVYAFPMYTARVLDLTSAETGALIGVFMLPFALLCYPAGRLGARVGQWRLVLAGSVAYGFAFASIPWVSGPALWAVMFLGGVLSAAMFGPTLVVVLDRSTSATRAAAMAGFNAAGSVGFLIGPLAAGGLLQLVAASEGDATATRTTFAVAAVFQLLAVAWAAARLRSEISEPSRS